MGSHPGEGEESSQTSDGGTVEAKTPLQGRVVAGGELRRCAFGHVYTQQENKNIIRSKHMYLHHKLLLVWKDGKLFSSIVPSTRINH